MKPENLFITTDGIVKILDFGLAKLDARDFTGSVGAFTTEGAILGTVGYMSPEQVKGQPADARSDIFSVGAVLYEMYCGVRAFEAETRVETMAWIVREEPDPIEAPPGIQEVITRCLRKDPAERFQSAQELRAALPLQSGQESRAALPGGAPVASPQPPAAAPISRPLLSAIAAVLLVLTLAGGWWGHRLWLAVPPTRIRSC